MQPAAFSKPIRPISGDAVLGELHGGQELHCGERNAQRAAAGRAQQHLGPRQPDRDENQGQHRRRDEDGERRLREAAQDGHAERRRQRCQPGRPELVAQLENRQPGKRHPGHRHHGANVLGAGGEVSAGLKHDGTGPGGDGPSAEVPKEMIRRNAGHPHLQDHSPLEEHRQAAGRGVCGDECAGEDQRVEKARLDIREDRVSAIAEWVPEREVALMELVHQERDHRQLHAPEVPGENIGGAEEGLMEEEGHVRQQRRVDQRRGAPYGHLRRAGFGGHKAILARGGGVCSRRRCVAPAVAPRPALRLQ